MKTTSTHTQDPSHEEVQKHCDDMDKSMEEMLAGLKSVRKS